MKLLHLASGDLWAGAEVQLFHLAKRLSRVSDVNLLVVLLNHGQLEQELRHQGVEVVVLDESTLSGTAIFRHFYRLIRRFKPDIVHTHRNKENVIGGLAAWLNGIKSIRTAHGASELTGGLFNFKRFIFDTLDKLAGRFLQQKIVAVSPELRNKLFNTFDHSSVAVIENCVDIEYVENRAKQPSPDIRAGCEEGFHIAFVGRFVPVKRVDLYYAIAKAVIRSQAEGSVHFHMLGDGPLKQEIETLLAQDKLAKYVHLHGFVENVAPMLNQMNLLIFTSDHEGLPMTLLEAMTLRVPVLSRQLPSIHRVLCEGGCGYFVDSDEVDAFAKQIGKIMSNANDMNIRAGNAHAMIETKYNIDINVNEYLQLYTDVTRGGSAS